MTTVADIASVARLFVVADCGVQKALLAHEAAAMQESLEKSQITFERRRLDCIEAETAGVNILNILGGLEYKVYGQSMTIEETGIGGRNVLAQIIVWTMGK